jgi:hypothetical protein
MTKDTKPEESATYQDWANTLKVESRVVDGLIRSTRITHPDGYCGLHFYTEEEARKFEECDENKPIVF